MNDLPDRELTPSELRQLIESNARAIQANSAANAQLRETLAEGFAAVQQDLTSLAHLMRDFFQAQANTNATLHEGLEGHEERLRQLEE